MRQHRDARLWAFCLALVVALGFSTHASEMNLLVVPTRITMVRMAFDLTGLCPATLVSCEARKGREPLLHVWDGAEWMRLELKTLGNDDFLQQTATRAIVIGDDDMIPASVLRALSWCPELIRVPSIRPVDIVNSLTEPLGLSRQDLAWLAGRHQLKVVDLNADLKKRDPYDVPWSEILPTEPGYDATPVAQPKPAVLMKNDKQITP